MYSLVCAHAIVGVAVDDDNQAEREEKNKVENRTRKERTAEKEGEKTPNELNRFDPLRIYI